jgi:hypothetical protein
MMGFRARAEQNLLELEREWAAGWAGGVSSRNTTSNGSLRKWRKMRKISALGRVLLQSRDVRDG